jgi:uncharacterized membrane protein YdjX (TVP38/TMEM64 family)
LYFLFSKFGIKEITTYNFIKSNSEYLVSFRESNLLLISITFIVFGILWVSVLQGFGSPLVLASGFLFGVYFGAVIAVITLSLGATLTYIFANFFFKGLIKEKFSNRFKFLEEKIQANEFIVILVYRFIGGIPFQIANLLPVLFNIKLKNYFFGTFLGIIPQVFIIASLGTGLENQIKKNTEPPSFFELLTSFEIFGPIIAFFFLLILSFIGRKLFFKK